MLQRLQQDGSELTPVQISQFSNLNSAEIQSLKSYWNAVSLGHRYQIVVTLVNMAEEDPSLDFNAVFTLCLRDSDESVRCQAISGLWECEERTLIKVLIDLMHRDPSIEVRATAAIGLGRFSTLAVEGKLLDKDAQVLQDALLEVIDDTDYTIEVYRRALEAIAPFNTTKIQQCIEKAYGTEKRELQCSAVYAMGKSCDNRWLDILLNELQNDDASIRYEAAQACGELGD